MADKAIAGGGDNWECMAVVRPPSWVAARLEHLQSQGHAQLQTVQLDTGGLLNLLPVKRKLAHTDKETGQRAYFEALNASLVSSEGSCARLCAAWRNLSKTIYLLSKSSQGGY
uniref:Uncharacterized protein n=1 Tax=Chromera velia CCMP2878 TaxID=1169474 RepID=A0A0G4ID40_9ALVE|eukprot:Cvel_13240.t1-p1 / transcript=Cvel_13240.t1 / gene=Cvel_13240 / organism=Chromera_velia_CCMP2878 / gene_product=hypothetical protein / transcript_product=hypothetical protein / location=Cvel_scaffold897:41140-41475(+) / protein_length=112 / sequence_SO=supercontig / SO=protein_coding / is_pseudo=false